MDFKELLRDFLISEGKTESLKVYDQFFDFCSEQQYDPLLTTEILANIDFKHRFAKYIVNRRMDGMWLLLSPNDDQDFRLCSFIAYYSMVKLLNRSLDEQQLNNLKFSLDLKSIRKGTYLPGYCVNEVTPYMPVIMRPGGSFQRGYRMFVINLLCFRDRKFMMGCRCDSGPVIGLKYHKGCCPIGEKTDDLGRKWTVFQVDASLTDDYTAIFSNFLDGDGTIEICDWINASDVRVVFRSNY